MDNRTRECTVADVRVDEPQEVHVYDLEVDDNHNFFCEGVLVHNCHHSPSVTFRSVLGALPGRYRFGLTATPTREDGLTPLLELCIGPVVFAMDHAELVEGGYLVTPEVRPLPTKCAPEVERYSDLVSALVADGWRNRFLSELAAEQANRGRPVLLLSARVGHCRHLAELIRERQVVAETLTGSLSRKKRHDVLERFRKGEVQVLCATSLADEGLDIASLECLILATPARAQGRTIQRLGRLMRPHPGKGTPVLFDVVDAHPMARNQFLARLTAYRQVLGKKALRRATLLAV